MTNEEAKLELERFVKLKTTQRPLFLDVAIKALEQPQVIRCKECMHCEWRAADTLPRCAKHDDYIKGEILVSPNDFCSDAERRIDECCEH